MCNTIYCIIRRDFKCIRTIQYKDIQVVISQVTCACIDYLFLMLKLTDVKIAYIYNKLSYLYASRVGIVMPINNFIMLLPDCLYDSNLTYMSIPNGHKFQSDICPFRMDVNSNLTYVNCKWTYNNFPIRVYE